ncbi:coenzyme F420-reducing hydrogenase delta subunit [Methanococcus maripaludis]|uniref:Coenzyme F420-reducing hydrogenase delta subunit n=2 Tax=Methanococcus maripaludis TaxID=39152 RepID=A0A7J9P7T5_METMI|nr:coenzyme F420-reducing hydrogenase delta subunit [Methanococcus maripaludis]MBA2859235.1 coenzyme F420-reducing hydrogenase delta subunit [Methanococcus maripaludis]
MFFMSGADAGKFTESVKEMTDRVKKLGPNPFKA